MSLTGCERTDVLHRKKDIFRGLKYMKEYKVMETSKKKAEQLMNDMAKQGWEVVSVTYWNSFKLCLLITFGRER